METPKWHYPVIPIIVIIPNIIPYHLYLMVFIPNNHWCNPNPQITTSPKPGRDLRVHEEVQRLHGALLRGQDVAGAGGGSRSAKNNEDRWRISIVSPWKMEKW